MARLNKRNRDKLRGVVADHSEPQAAAATASQPSKPRDQVRSVLVGGSVAFALSLTWESLALAGVINIPLAHYLIVAAYVFSILAIYTAEPYWAFAARHRLKITGFFAVALGLATLGVLRLEQEPPRPPKVATQGDVQQARSELQQLRASFDRALPRYNGSTAQLFDVKFMNNWMQIPPYKKDTLGILNVVREHDGKYYVTPINAMMHFKNITKSPQTIIAYSVEESYGEDGPWWHYCNVYAFGGDIGYNLGGGYQDAIDTSVLLENSVISKTIQANESLSGWAMLQCSVPDHCMGTFIRLKLESAAGEVFSHTFNVSTDKQNSTKDFPTPTYWSSHTDLTIQPNVVRNDCMPAK